MAGEVCGSEFKSAVHTMGLNVKEAQECARTFNKSYNNESRNMLT